MGEEAWPLPPPTPFLVLVPLFSFAFAVAAGEIIIYNSNSSVENYTKRKKERKTYSDKSHHPQPECQPLQQDLQQLMTAAVLKKTLQE